MQKIIPAKQTHPCSRAALLEFESFSRIGLLGDIKCDSAWLYAATTSTVDKGDEGLKAKIPSMLEGSNSYASIGLIHIRAEDTPKIESLLQATNQEWLDGKHANLYYTRIRPYAYIMALRHLVDKSCVLISCDVFDYYPTKPIEEIIGSVYQTQERLESYNIKAIRSAEIHQSSGDEFFDYLRNVPDKPDYLYFYNLISRDDAARPIFAEKQKIQEVMPAIKEGVSVGVRKIGNKI